jgi:hypothetical protein
METTTAFDLNQAIQGWCENLRQSPAFRSENLYELETHLRDAITALQGSGLSDEEAFIIAAKRLGRNSQLEAEFAKQNGRSVWLDRALWILIGAQIWVLATNLTQFLQAFANVSLSSINGWLATYGFSIIAESIPAQVFYVVMLPLTLLLGLKACLIFQRWTHRRGWSPASFMLNRPYLLAGVYAILALSPYVLNLGVGLLAHKYGINRAFNLAGVSPYTLIALVVVHTVFFAAVVMIIARKRLTAA